MSHNSWVLFSIGACGVSASSTRTRADCATPIGAAGSPTKLKVEIVGSSLTGYTFFFQFYRAFGCREKRRRRKDKNSKMRAYDGHTLRWPNTGAVLMRLGFEPWQSQTIFFLFNRHVTTFVRIAWKTNAHESKAAY